MVDATSFSISRMIQLSLHPLFAFAPQMLATGGAGLALARWTTLEFAWFIQTLIFVTFNKVCTSQVSLVWRIDIDLTLTCFP